MVKISNEDRRWIVIGLCLIKVLPPALRDVVAREMSTWHQELCQPPTEIDKQVYPDYKKWLSLSTLPLNYENINGNYCHRLPAPPYQKEYNYKKFDYKVKDPLSLAKLFFQSHMCKFTGFDETMDPSAVLSLICEAAPFEGAAATHARAVRSDVRNEWAHAKLKEWTEAKFKTAFQSMESLLQSVNLSPDDEWKWCYELNSCKTKGFDLCFGELVDKEILTFLKNAVDELRKAVQTWSSEQEQINALISYINDMQTQLAIEVDDLRTDLKRCADQINSKTAQTDNNSKRLKITALISCIDEMQTQLAKEIDDLRTDLKRCVDQTSSYMAKTDNNSKRLKVLEDTKELSRFYGKEEEKIPYVFTAPPKNRCFTGRTKEIQKLKRILKIEETSSEKNVRVAAVCGLGGIGKTSLVSEYAHQMKDFYKGGVYWFSAEDDARLCRTVNDVAAGIGAFSSAVHLPLSNILKKISSLNDPCLIVLDCVDQHDISYDVREFLDVPSKWSIFGHFIVVTRKSKEKLVNEVNGFKEEHFLTLDRFSLEEAKEFLFARSEIVRDENVESDAKCLCEELGRLPLALEQAGAYIKRVGPCTLALYLEEYKKIKFQLFEWQKARPASNEISPDRLSVHTTWHMDIKYLKKISFGQAAVRFMNACYFFDENEIQKELPSVELLKVEDVAYRECLSSALVSGQVFKLLTDFSLFTYVKGGSVSTNRMVQEVVWDNLRGDSKSKAETLINAVQMLFYAFSNCPSPHNHASLDATKCEEHDISFSDPPDSHSHFFMWSTFCMHGHQLHKKVVKEGLDSDWLDSVWSLETAKILYECAVHLSANHQQEEAKRTLNFAYRVLDWIPSEKYETVVKDFSGSFFRLPIPLPMLFETKIPEYCIPIFTSPKSLPEKVACDTTDPAPDATDLAPDATDLAPDATIGSAPDPTELTSSDATCLDLDTKMNKFELDGNKFFKEGCYQEAVVAYSSAINLAQDCSEPFNSLPKRSVAYINLEQWQNALKDANDYITRHPDSWKGYTLKALALDGLNKEVSAETKDTTSAEIAAALAFYYNRDIFADFPIFVKTFPDLQSRIFICDSVDELLEFSQVETDLMKILVLGSKKEYILNSAIVGKPWNNCILVGTRKNCSVTLKSDCEISLSKCMLTNLSFSFNEYAQLHCLPDSVVKILNCNFTSCDDRAKTIKTKGMFNAEQCNFTKCPLLCEKQSCAVIRDCLFWKNLEEGICVKEGTTFKMEGSCVYDNGSYGVVVENTAACSVVNCKICNNGFQGITVRQSESVELIRNNVSNNNARGILLFRCFQVCVKENNVYGNGNWGIRCTGLFERFEILTNKISQNKGGGVIIFLLEDEDYNSSSVIEGNKICYNHGPGFLVNNNEVLEGRFSHSLNSPQIVKIENNEIHHNNKGSDSSLNLPVPYCSYCRVKCNPTKCEKCFTSAYCSISCQEQHYLKHKKICKVLREKSSYLITSMQKSSYELEVECVEDSKEVGPKFSDPPPQDGRKFVVKVYNSTDELGIYRVYLHDRSLNLSVKFISKVVYQLVNEFGVMCKKTTDDKKLFFHCLFEDNGHLRIFTNEFAEGQDW